VSERLPIVSGAQLISALEQLGWEAVRQRGSHVRLRHQDRATHRSWCRCTAN
jgi:predicted RNA binding protein YcfA (HicA-like mRNA interferase family)